MRTFLNNHPVAAVLIAWAVVSGVVEVAKIIKEKSIIDKVDIIVINKRNSKTTEKKEENVAEKVESVEE